MRKRDTVISASVVAILAIAIAGVLLWRAYSAREESLRLGRKAVFEEFGIPSDGTRDFLPLPPIVPHEMGPAAIGSALFHEKKLSIAKPPRTCITCHPLDRGGTDNAIHDGLATRPTVNAVFARRWLHDGSITNIRDVVELMLVDDRYCRARSLPGAANRLLRDKNLPARFSNVFSDGGLCASNIVKALVEHLKTQIGANGPFDAYLQGDDGAISENAKKGLSVFRRQKCTQCHAGPAMGGLSVTEEGRKVQSLRGLGGRKTYMDGTRDDLGAVLSLMPEGGIEGEDREFLLEFLRVL